MNKLRYDVMPHSPYLPDLAPADFHLVPKLKKDLGGLNEDLQASVEEYFCEESVFRNGIKA